jgi:hypothetical protein
MSQSTYSPYARVNALASACCTLRFPLFLGDVGSFITFLQEITPAQDLGIKIHKKFLLLLCQQALPRKQKIPSTRALA